MLAMFFPLYLLWLFSVTGFLEVQGIVINTQPGNVHTIDTKTSFSIQRKQSAFDLPRDEVTTTNSELLIPNEENESANGPVSRDLSLARNAWELVSSSSDVIPVRRNIRNESFLPHHYHPQGQGSRKENDDSLQPLNLDSRVQMRLHRLEHHFNTLQIYDDDCRQRLLCEIAESPEKFSPLTGAFLDETSFNGDEKTLASMLLETTDGTKLLAYIEAAQRGASRQGCEVWTYRCPRTANSMIDYKALLVWRDIAKWLTVRFVARNPER